VKVGVGGMGVGVVFDDNWRIISSDSISKFSLGIVVSHARINMDTTIVVKETLYILSKV
jgi:hypothetical protein